MRTKGEWYADLSSAGQGLIASDDPETRGATIALTYDSRGVDAQDNADFIVKACNNHDALINALTMLTEKIERANSLQHSGGIIDAEGWSELYALANEARGALREVTP